jgi:hypothetical protein
MAEDEAQPAGGRAQRRADGQLPLPLFSTMPTTQPPPEGAAQVASDTHAESSSEDEEEEDTENFATSLQLHALGAAIDDETRRVTVKYHHYQQVFVESLFTAPIAECDEVEFWDLFATGPQKANGNGDVSVTLQTSESFKKAARMVVREPDFEPSHRLLRPLRKTIRYRLKAQKWFERLQPGDPRCEKREGHRKFNELLKGVYQTLSGGSAY